MKMFVQALWRCGVQMVCGLLKKHLRLEYVYQANVPNSPPAPLLQSNRQERSRRSIAEHGYFPEGQRVDGDVG